MPNPAAIQIRDPGTWQLYTEETEAPWSEIVSICTSWMELMQQKMAAGDALTEETVLACRQQADPKNWLEGDRLGWSATSLIAKCWVHGPAFEEALG